MFEPLTKPLISSRSFAQRLLTHFGFSLLLLILSLIIGVVGYRSLESLSWLDSLLNASMILSGMGPVDDMKTAGGKLFASFYALYSGLFLVICTGLLLAPVFHRILHSMHVDADDKEG